MSESTPMMQQYLRLKLEHKDSVLFFRLGDFYEMFNQDAHEVSALLNITLTKRNGIPMCGIPYHAAKNYIARLLKAGKKIAVCEQVGLPKAGQGIVERKVTEIITPGTVVDEDFLEKSRNNYLLALGKLKTDFSFAYLDLSTGEFFTTAFGESELEERLKKEMGRLSPHEIIIQESLWQENVAMRNILEEQSDLLVNRFPDWNFDMENSRQLLIRQFKVVNLKGFGLNDGSPEVLAAGVILEYISDTSKSLLPHISALNVYDDSHYLDLDEATQKNLELVWNLQDRSKRFTLLEVMDHTKTAMGSRKFRYWILHPLTNRHEIKKRQDKVTMLYKNQMVLSLIRERLPKILDLERLSARISLEKAHAKDLLAIKNSLVKIIEVDQILKEWKATALLLIQAEEDVKTLRALYQLLEDAVDEDPSILLTEGRLIKAGYNSELDQLRTLKNNSQRILDEYLETERKNSRIGSLKIRHNKIIGYYLEVTKTNLHLVPDNFIRRQSLVASERFTTEKLTELEIRLNSVNDQIVELEKKIFLAVRDQLKERIHLLLKVCGAVSDLDCYQSLAHLATIHGYVAPKIDNTKQLKITEGRHPVVEIHLAMGEFIPNGLNLDSLQSSFALITGPNMAGKSTFLRQTALIVLMAQMGSYVPAREVALGVVDKIFCRVGASDNLARGESTFLVEMNEASNILRSATSDSLIIMDEIGRGTSTNDGLAIAWAITEFLLETLPVKTLFATHYHELTNITHRRLHNLSMEVVEKKGEIIFLKKIKEGPANNSYGIHVAKLAGLPRLVIQRAQEILTLLEEKETSLDKSHALGSLPESSMVQDELFTPTELITAEIRHIPVDQLTPLEALNKIADWKKTLEDGGE